MAGERYMEGVLGGSSSTALSPIEVAFRRRYLATLSAYQEYCATMMAAAGNNGEQREERLRRGVALLVADFERHAASVAPSPFLLPTSATLVVTSRNNMRVNVQVRPTHMISDVRHWLVARYNASGDPIDSFAEESDCRLYLRERKAPASASAPAPAEERVFEISDPSRTIFEQCPNGRLDPSAWDMVFAGTFTLTSERAAVCFKSEYRPGDDTQRVDYYSCATCAITWVCPGCAERCHRRLGHDVRVQLRAHRPNYACCYCPKKKKCSMMTTARTAETKR